MWRTILGPPPEQSEQRIIRINFGRGRVISRHHAPSFYIHRSVEIRLNDVSLGSRYRYKAKAKDNQNYVVV
ncbi:hypothetical protein LXA43DRAFT_1013620, partial [Ganoderma leucocontextum]